MPYKYWVHRRTNCITRMSDREDRVLSRKCSERIEVLEGKAKPGAPTGMPGNKPKSGRRPEEKKGPESPGPKALPAIG